MDKAMDLRVPTDERLRQAAVDRDSVTIKKILKNWKGWKSVDDKGETLLRLAFTNEVNILANQQAIIQALQCFLDEGLDVDAEIDGEKTILFLAVKHRLRDVIDFLIKSGADLNAFDEYGNTIVHFLVKDHKEKYYRSSIESQPNIEHEDIDFMNWLLSKGVNVDCKNYDERTALHIAIDYILIHLVRILIKFMNDVHNYDDEEGCTIVEYLYERNSGHVDIVMSLLNKGISVDHVDNRGDTLVHTFLKYDKQVPEIIRWILQRYNSVNARDHAGDTALHILIEYSIRLAGEDTKDTGDYVRILLSRGANVYLKNFAGDTPVRLAVRAKNFEALKALSEYGADFKPSGNRGALLLHEISMAGQYSSIDDVNLAPMVDMFVHAGWDVNAVRPADRFTPLMEACRFSSRAVAQKLIDNGADVNYAEDRNLTRPIHAAAMANGENSEALFEILVDAGANVNAKNVYGVTALHFVSRKSCYSASETLLDLGADFEVRDDCGRSPLYSAVAAANVEGIKALLEFGADVNDEDVLRILNEQKIKGLNDDKTVDCLMKHWLKLKAVDLPVIDGFANFAKKTSLQEFYVECLKEVETLKTYQLNERTTLYDQLHVDVRERCFFIANNERLKNLVESSSLEDIFPKYQILLSAHYRMAVARQPLIEPARQAWYYLTKIELPDICVRQILIHLKNEDLRLMAEEDDEIESLKRPSQLQFEEYAKKKRLM